MLNVNLGCGPVFVDSAKWLNLDFSPKSFAVRQANLLDRLPLDDESAQLIYSSHFLEHVPRKLVPALLSECFRVLQPGGVVRLVVPDLESMAREYLSMREAGDHEKADFVVLELIDQCVRRESGGDLGLYYRQMAAQTYSFSTPMIDYIRERTGENLRDYSDARRLRNLRHAFSVIRNRCERAWIRICLLALPTAFRAQNISLAAVGEQHHWLWDFHQLKSTLEAADFVDVQRFSATSSSVGDFPFQPLDLDDAGQPRKGKQSLFLEARKPTLT